MTVDELVAKASTEVHSLKGKTLVTSDLKRMQLQLLWSFRLLLAMCWSLSLDSQVLVMVP